ncbi:hypothetical protein OS127_02980 [Corynebacterium sp. P6129]|uniref:hypothetical protein n=1 Tax=Corynebacterium antarcticum TaxID=2800405 RepID=UPI002260FEA6|nr:hypothetical protein [Corynebacterium antarcticum]MCX7491492.1 hypothetical protein [Corynebacterium antarcticum]
MTGPTASPLTNKIYRILAEHGIDDTELARKIAHRAARHHNHARVMNIGRWKSAPELTDTLLTLAYGPLDPDIDPAHAHVLRTDGLLDRNGRLTPKGVGVAAYIDAHQTAKARA